MKNLKILVCIAILFAVIPTAKAQWLVTDPTNLAQGIVNSARQIIQTSSTATNMINN